MNFKSVSAFVFAMLLTTGSVAFANEGQSSQETQQQSVSENREPSAEQTSEVETTSQTRKSVENTGVRTRGRLVY
jgi:hypothetical protein